MLPISDQRNPLLFDGVAAGDDDGHLRQAVGLNGRRYSAAAVGQLLIDHARLNRVKPEPPVCFWDVGVHEAKFPGLFEEVSGVLHRPVEFGCGRYDLVASKSFGNLLEGLLLVRQLKGKAAALRCNWRGG